MLPHCIVTLLCCFTLLACSLSERRKLEASIEAANPGYSHSCMAAATSLHNRAFFAGGNASGPVSVGSDGVTAVNPSDPNYGRIDILNTFKETNAGKQVFFPTWELSKLSMPRSGVAMAAGASSIYVAGGQLGIRDNYGGGYDYSKWQRTDVDVYDLSGKLLHTYQLSEARSLAAAYYYAGKIFIAGGYNGKSGDYGSLCVGNKCFYRSKVLDIFDEATGQWSALSMPDDRLGASIAGVDNKLYFGGGGTNNFGNFFNVLDLNDLSWSTLNISKPLISSFFSIDSKIYHGCNYSGNVDVYDVPSDSWDEIKVPTPLSQCSFFALGRKLVVALGTTIVTKMNETPSFSHTVQLYDVDTGDWQLTELPVAKSYPAIVGAGERFVIFAGGYVDGSVVNRVDIYDANLEHWFGNNGEPWESATTHQSTR